MKFYYASMFFLAIMFYALFSFPSFYAQYIVKQNSPYYDIRTDKIFSFHFLNSQYTEWGFQSDLICGRYILVDQINKSEQVKLLMINLIDRSVSYLTEDGARQYIKFNDQHHQALIPMIISINLIDKFFI